MAVMLLVGSSRLYFALHHGIELTQWRWPFLGYATYEAHARVMFDRRDHEDGAKNRPPPIAHGLQVIHARNGGLPL
jgi:hypothetical protein